MTKRKDEVLFMKCSIFIVLVLSKKLEVFKFMAANFYFFQSFLAFFIHLVFEIMLFSLKIHC